DDWHAGFVLLEDLDDFFDGKGLALAHGEISLLWVYCRKSHLGYGVVFREKVKYSKWGEYTSLSYDKFPMSPYAIGYCRKSHF
ncbi:hypothetical protein D6779_07805, partial [Candidatus Parcubacteria bacterium]